MENQNTITTDMTEVKRKRGGKRGPRGKIDPNRIRPVERMQIALRRLATKRLPALVSTLERWAPLRSEAETALAKLKFARDNIIESMDRIGQIESTFTLPVGRKSLVWEEDMYLRLKPAKAAELQDLLGEEEVGEEWRVISCKGKSVVVRSESGTKLLLASTCFVRAADGAEEGQEVDGDEGDEGDDADSDSDSDDV
jgi:hypothetical protein